MFMLEKRKQVNVRNALKNYPEMAGVTINLAFDAIIIQYGVVAGVKKFTH